MFKTVGNGVPYLAALGLALTIMDFLKRGQNYEVNSEQYRESDRKAS
jgi:hypothetical protein